MILPRSVIELMWEYDSDALASQPVLPDALLERVLARGRLEDMLWLLDTVGRERICTFLERRGRRTLAPREIRFWSFITGVPEDRAAEWVREARRRENVWKG